MEGEEVSDHGGGYGSTDGEVSDGGEPATPPPPGPGGSPPGGTQQSPPPPPYRPPQRRSHRIAVESKLPPFNHQDLFNISAAANRAQQRAAFQQAASRPAQRPPLEAACDAAPHT